MGWGYIRKHPNTFLQSWDFYVDFLFFLKHSVSFLVLAQYMLVKEMDKLVH